jgi:hypothetical protein
MSLGWQLRMCLGWQLRMPKLRHAVTLNTIENCDLSDRFPSVFLILNAETPTFLIVVIQEALAVSLESVEKEDFPFLVASFTYFVAVFSLTSTRRFGRNAREF